MKRTQILDALRNIKKERVSWLSILVIAALAVMAYLGINFGADAISNNGDIFYANTNFRDIEIVSTMLITEDDIEAVRSVEGISDAEGLYSTSGKAVSGKSADNVNVISLTERINVPVVVEGRLPENENECAIEPDVADTMDVKVGDTLEVQNNDGGAADYLKSWRYTIVGIVWHADNPILKVAMPGNRYVIVTKDAFDTEATDGAYMRAVAKIEGADKYKYINDSYLSYISETYEKVKTLAETREALRTAYIKNTYADEIAKAEGEVSDAENKLLDGRKELDDGWDEYRDGEKELAEAKLEIEENEVKLSDAEKELNSGRGELDSAKAQLEDAKRQLDRAKREIDDGEKEYADGVAKLEEAKAQLDDGKAQLDEGRAELDDAKAQLDDAEKQLAEGKAELDEAEAEIAKNEKLLEDGKRQLDAGEAELEAAGYQLSDGRTQLEDGWQRIEDMKKQSRDAIREAIKIGIENSAADPQRKEEIMARFNEISWAQPESDAEVSRRGLRAMDFKLTDDITIDLEEVDDAIKTYGSYLPVAQEALIGISDNLDLSDEEMAAVNAAMGLLNIGELTVEAADQLFSQFREWDKGHEEYLSGLSAYSAGYWELMAGKREYEDGVKALEEGKRAFAEALEKYMQGLSEYESGKEEYEAGEEQYAEKYSEYEQGAHDYEDGELALKEAREKLDNGIAEYEQGLRDYNSALKKYQNGEKEYAEGLSEYNEGVTKLADGKKAYADGVVELAEAKEKLENGEQDYSDGAAELEDGKAKLNEVKNEFAELDECRWVVLDAEGSAGYIGIKDTADNMKALGVTFALLFVLVGALVIYSTVGKIVEEQRKLVGATKALGLYNREIFAKYLFFGLSATLIGSLLGIVLGYAGIQYVVLIAYASFYVYGIGTMSFLPGLAAVVISAGAALTAAAVWGATSSLIKTTATKLMQEKTPDIKHKNSDKKSRLPLYTRLILLNMRTDLKRIAVTVVSIAGICALLIAGFTMKMAISGAITNQFKEITLYDAIVTFNAETLPSVEPEVKDEISKVGAESLKVYLAPANYTASGKLSAASLIVADLDKLQDYFHYVCPEAEGNGVIINFRAAEKKNLSVGDSITMYNSAMKPFEAKVIGIFDNYIGGEMLMSEESYKSVFGEEVKKNAYFINGENASSIGAVFSEMPGFVSFTDAIKTRESYEAMTSVLNVVAVLLTGVAGAMAYFILLNLINMYISQKKRELTIMRVNGFTVREVKNYVARESIATTLLGLIVGCVGGVMFAKRVVMLIETASAKFLRDIQWGGVALAVVITVVFTAAINAFALRKIKYLKLTDVQ